MRRISTQRICLLLLASIIWWPMEGAERKRKLQARRNTDSLIVTIPSSLSSGPDGTPEIPSSRKMNTSAFPVQITVTGRVVQIQSDHNQLLPIYTHNGVLYITARLNKGTNWLGGLPRGHYFINNRPLTIN